jgi:hypothetical protein
MPVVFRYKGVRFFFYSNEGSPRLAELAGVVAENRELIERHWHEHFG